MKQWALIVCVVCITVGVAELLLPEGNNKKGIKTMIALYVLLAVVAGNKYLRNNEYTLNWDFFAEPANYSEYVIRQNQMELEKALEDTLKKHNIAAEITVEEEEGKYIVKFKSEQSEETCKILKNILKNDVDLEVRTGENGT